MEATCRAWKQRRTACPRKTANLDCADSSTDHEVSDQYQDQVLDTDED